jgi:hypothetical protein
MRYSIYFNSACQQALNTLLERPDNLTAADNDHVFNIANGIITRALADNETDIEEIELVDRAYLFDDNNNNSTILEIVLSPEGQQRLKALAVSEVGATGMIRDESCQLADIFEAALEKKIGKHFSENDVLGIVVTPLDIPKLN